LPGAAIETTPLYVADYVLHMDEGRW